MRSMTEVYTSIIALVILVVVVFYVNKYISSCDLKHGKMVKSPIFYTCISKEDFK